MGTTTRAKSKTKARGAKHQAKKDAKVPSVHGKWKPFVIKTIVEDMSFVRHQIIFVVLPSLRTNLELILDSGWLSIRCHWPQCIQDLSILDKVKGVLDERNTRQWESERRDLGDSAPSKEKFMKEKNEFNALFNREMRTWLRKKKNEAGGHQELFETTRIKLDIPVANKIADSDCQFIWDEQSGARLLFLDFKEKTPEQEEKHVVKRFQMLAREKDQEE